MWPDQSCNQRSLLWLKPGASCDAGDREDSTCYPFCQDLRKHVRVTVGLALGGDHDTVKVLFCCFSPPHSGRLELVQSR